MPKKERRKFDLDVPTPASQKSLDSPEFQAFVEGAKTRSLDAPLSPPWAGLDPEAKPSKSKAISLRINDYERALLSYICQKERRSFQNAIRGILVNLIEEKAKTLFWSESK